ncbi:unnamed protein product, partial [Brenthis ino]
MNGELKKGISEPDILSKKSVESGSTLDIRKRWKLIKPPFRKGAFDCLLRWRGKRPQTDQSSRFRPRRPISMRLANCAGDIIVLKCTRRHKCTLYSYHSHTPVGRPLDTTGES